MKAKVVSLFLGWLAGNALLLVGGVLLYKSSAAFLPAGWQVSYTLGRFNEGAGYLEKTTTALIGLGALVAEEALYYTLFKNEQDKILDGSKNSYLLHFDKEELPKAKAFWSITMYDKDSFLVPNVDNKFAIGDRTEGLLYNEDGSLDIYISFYRPKENLANWLPAPEGLFSLTLRAYLPDESMQENSWLPPQVITKKLGR